MEPNYDQKMLIVSSFVLLLLSSAQLINADLFSSLSSIIGGDSPSPPPRSDFSFPDESGPNYISEPPAGVDSPSPTPTGSFASTPTESTAPTPSPTPTRSPSPSPTPTPSQSPGPTSTPTPSQSPSPSPTATPTPSQSPNPSPSPSPTATPTPSQSPNPSPSPARSANPKLDVYVKKICDSTDYPSLCMTQFTSLVGDNLDPSSLLKMATSSVINKVNSALESATQYLAEAEAKNPDIAGALSDCKESYEDAVVNLKSALDAVQSKDMDTANTMLSGAITDFTTCSDGFTSEKNPMTQYGKTLTDLVGNCLEIATMVKKK